MLSRKEFVQSQIEYCMYQNCLNCKEKLRSFSLTKNSCEEIIWQQWQRKTERKTITAGKESKENVITITVKESCKGTIDELVSSFELNCVNT